MNTTLLFRRAVLAVAGSKAVRGLVTHYGMRFGAARFVAAETLEETLVKVRRMNERGFAVTLDYLGESVETPELAEEAAVMIERTLDGIARDQLDSNVSLKLTQLGLLLDEKLCLRLTDRIVERARRQGNFVRIDMEDSAVTDATLRICETLIRKHGREHVGPVIQSYLYRSPRDRMRLEALGANVRFVKGAYSEPKSIAFADKKLVDRQYVALAEAHMRSGCYAAIATHDRRIVDRLKRVRFARGVARARFEFQMLYGIAEDLQRELLGQGYRVRIYTPFGKHWYAYFSRRIAERPANLMFVVRGLARGRAAAKRGGEGR